MSQETQSVRRYKLLLGDHETKDAEGNPVIYRPGMIIESAYDLLLFNGGRNMQPKFELVDDHAGISDENAQLRDENAELKRQLAELTAAAAA